MDALTTVYQAFICGLIFAYTAQRYLLRQPDYFPKECYDWRQAVRYGLVKSLLYILLALPFSSVTWLAVVGCIAFLHTMLEVVFREVRLRRDGLAFQLSALEPTVQITVIIGVCIAAYSRLSSPMICSLFARFDYRIISQILLLGTGYLFIFRGGTEIVRSVLSYVEPIQHRQEGQRTAECMTVEELRVGEIIGNIERFLILSLVFLEQYTAIAFVLAVKAVARSKVVEDDPEFSRYYLVGTLASAAVAMAVGLLIKVLPLWDA